MKVIFKTIEMIAWFTEDGTPRPIRFKVKNEDESTTVIKVDRVLYKEKEKIAGNPMILFRCQSVINEASRVYELKYEMNTCKWLIYKM
ncbi:MULTISPECIES: hypothetical protein [Clostridium]|uniref:Uncharacterized protein n=1 Tax=Clostridium paridis TaxID=2803863 RepID=A0A937FGV1_9CLOT|nr:MULTISPECIES: hypothetical protein [Clostridium]MBL4931788.1 hypothetical protein [Clostridium paridis]MDD7793504.1 hypothetical protein [Clostridium sp. 'White wine YQ']